MPSERNDVLVLVHRLRVGRVDHGWEGMAARAEAACHLAYIGDHVAAGRRMLPISHLIQCPGSSLLNGAAHI